MWRDDAGRGSLGHPGQGEPLLSVSLDAMRIVKDKIWTWFLPDNERSVNRDLWFHQGGKWLIFDRREKMIDLAHKLETFIDAGEVESAKIWNGNPSAINVYSLDGDSEKVKAILDQLGAKRHKVWEYDYAWHKNIQRPIDFFYSWSSKFMTILRSKGIHGTVQLFKIIIRHRISSRNR